MEAGILKSVSRNDDTGREGRSNHTQWSERNNYMRDKVTVPAIQARKGGPKIKVVTAYDAPSARIADRAGADIILVGDTLAHVVLGFDDTLPATVDIMIHHTAAVARTKPGAMVLGDMPWLSYHLSMEQTVRNAGRLMREGGAEAVKLEGGRERFPMIKPLLSPKIPAMGHLALPPQPIHTICAYRIQSNRPTAARNFFA